MAYSRDVIFYRAENRQNMLILEFLKFRMAPISLRMFYGKIEVKYLSPFRRFMKKPEYHTVRNMLVIQMRYDILVKAHLSPSFLLFGLQQIKVHA